MDFARRILTNYGWKDGDGLGKNKDGIAKPLKATLKFDKSGFGADQASEDFNNRWWERVFNEAATNVNINKEGEEIKLNLKNEENSVEISTKGYSMKKLKKLNKSRGDSGANKTGYANFLRAATLTNLGSEVENPDKIDINSIEVSKVNILTDEELFKACGGRTAHKGARHGLKLSGKLSRIEQQEAEMLAKIMENNNCFGGDKQIKKKLTKSDNFQNQYEEQIKSNRKAKKELCEDGATKRKKLKLSTLVGTESDIASMEFPVANSKIRKLKRNTKEIKKVGSSDVQALGKECGHETDYPKTKKEHLTTDSEKINLNKKKNKKKI